MAYECAALFSEMLEAHGTSQLIGYEDSACFSFLSNKAQSVQHFSFSLCYIQIILIRSLFRRESPSDLIVEGASYVIAGFLV